jgi:MFS family permease
LLLVIFGVVCLALYVRHAATAKNPILDLKLLRIPTFRVGVGGGSFFRIGVGAIPFLMPLMFQLGFGLSAFQSGLLTCWAAVGALTMKFSTSSLLHRFGFRLLLIVNGVATSLLIAAYGLLSAATPYLLIALLLLVSGFLRSLQFTALNALTYSDISRANSSNASTFYAVAQQFSLSAGVAVAAFVLEAVQALRGEAIIASDDFSVGFIVVAGIAVLSVFQFMRLDANAGSSVLSRRKPIPPESVAEGPVEL